MKTLLILVVFAAFLALTWGHHGRRRGGCGRGYDDDDDDDDDYSPRCGRGRYESDSGHGYGGYGGYHREREAGHGCFGGCGRREREDGHGRHEKDSGHGYGGYGKRRGHHDNDDDDDEDDHVYRFMIGGEYGPYEYLDENGYLQGFYVDLIKAVCKKAGKRCSYLMDTYEHCWTTEGEREFPGVGLLDGWYDGCMGMLPTPERLNSFNFTSAFSPNFEAALLWREKDEGDRKNLTGRKIGFLEGWAFSQRCLKRQHDIVGHDNFQAVSFENHHELVDALLHNEVDAILSADAFDSKNMGIVAEAPSFQCTERGMSVMTHYYSDVINWWNCALARLRRSGDFKALCAQAQETHGHRGEIRCL